MRLTVLGGSAAGPNIGQGCSGYLVSGAGTSIVLDLGPGTFPELRRHVDYRSLDAVVISHLHLDHILDLLTLRFALAYNPVPPRGRLPLWLPPGGLDLLDRCAAAFATDDFADHFGRVFAAAEYDPQRELPIGGLSLAFRRTVHYVPCWAMRVRRRDPGGDLTYTADTGPTADLAPFARGSAVLIAEAAADAIGDEPIESRGHLTALEAGELARRSEVATLVLTHLWEEHGIERAGTAAAAAFTGRLEIARPGLTIEW